MKKLDPNEIVICSIDNEQPDKALADFKTSQIYEVLMFIKNNRGIIFTTVIMLGTLFYSTNEVNAIDQVKTKSNDTGTETQLEFAEPNLEFEVIKNKNIKKFGKNIKKFDIKKFERVLEKVKVRKFSASSINLENNLKNMEKEGIQFSLKDLDLTFQSFSKSVLQARLKSGEGFKLNRYDRVMYSGIFVYSVIRIFKFDQKIINIILNSKTNSPARKMFVNFYLVFEATNKLPIGRLIKKGLFLIYKISIVWRRLTLLIILPQIRILSISPFKIILISILCILDIFSILDTLFNINRKTLFSHEDYLMLEFIEGLFLDTTLRYY